MGTLICRTYVGFLEYRTFQCMTKIMYRYSSSQRVNLKQKFVNKSDPLLYGLNLNHLAHILMYGWG